MKKKNIKKSRAGREGARVRWMKREEAIYTLCKWYSKQHINEFITWPTKHLITLVKLNEKNAKLKRSPEQLRGVKASVA